MKIALKENEYWYGGCVSWGMEMPLHGGSTWEGQLSPNPTANQAMPLLLSNQGRILWLEGCDKLRLRDGVLECGEGALLLHHGESLRSAFAGAAERFFPGVWGAPGEKFREAPIFNSWIELTYHQNQAEILSYAREILNHGFQPGVLMIDDTWAMDYGDWQFHPGRFPAPGAMLRELHEMGFTVMLWVCPYVSPDGAVYRSLLQKELLLTKQDGSPFLANWWNGYSACLDVTKPEACAWLHTQLQALTALGVDGFKFDGGDPCHYSHACSGGTPADPNEICRCWSRLGARYPYNEYRASWKAAGLPLLQRLCDKNHSWDDRGLAALIPDTLLQGITGHPFCCADMVGGGNFLDFEPGAGRLDPELFVHHAAVSALMPTIQFSAAPWNVLTPEQMQILGTQMALRKHWLPVLREAWQEAAQTGVPIARYIEYEFPHQGCEAVTDQFMLGSRLLVAPILKKGAECRWVYLPRGRWRVEEQILESRGEKRKFSAPDTKLVVLERLEGPSFREPKDDCCR